MDKVKKIVIWFNPGVESKKIAPRIDSDRFFENGTVERKTRITKEEALELVNQLPFEELDK